MDISNPLTLMAGVGEKRAEQFERLGIFTISDLLHFYPRSYDDYGAAVTLDKVTPGKITVIAAPLSVTGRYVRRGLHITEAVLADKTGELRAVWFNQPYRAAQIEHGREYYFSGSYEFSLGRYVLMNPSTGHAEAADKLEHGIVPVYRETKGLKSAYIRRVMTHILPLADELPDTLPSELLAKFKLCSYARALRAMHSPVSPQEIEVAKHRLAFEELLAVIMAAVINKRENAVLGSWHIPFDVNALKRFSTGLPFTLTNAQRKAVWEIIQNFSASQPMNRLLQGDVGSGKTVVAAMAAFVAATAGYQTAFMAPTELLARQHATTLDTLIAPYHMSVGLLTGSVKSKGREQLLEHIRGGAIAITVGTHALIQPAVKFHKLGFVVIDEQHRFGVEQRAALLAKSSGRMPHLLSMSATPIPRSLALTVYGELDISILDELPAGRQPIITRLGSPNSRTQIYTAIDAAIDTGRQAYIVCPQIDPADVKAKGKKEPALNEETKSVESAFAKLSGGHFKHRKLLMLHGKMKSEEKQKIMALFSEGKADILVSTTVIEVGVDVPNATIIAIEYADQFGLAQLHQLRGRVGRSDYQSYCYLIPASSKAPSRRLRELERSTDGFYLAEIDLELRGPGEVYGRSQHGQLDLRVARLGDTKLVKEVRTAAKWLLDSGINMVQYTVFNNRIENMRRVITLN